MLAVGPLNGQAVSRSLPLGAIIAAATAALPRSPRPNLTSGMERARASPALVASMWTVEIAAGRGTHACLCLVGAWSRLCARFGCARDLFDSWRCLFFLMARLGSVAGVAGAHSTCGLGAVGLEKLLLRRPGSCFLDVLLIFVSLSTDARKDSRRTSGAHVDACEGRTEAVQTTRSEVYLFARHRRGY